MSNRIVLDTNALIQCISPRSKYHYLWRQYLYGPVRLCVSTEILDEYAEVLGRLTNETIASYVLSVLTQSPHTEFITPSYRFNLIKNDEDDNKFVDCAICAGARYIVTNDHHYDVLKDIEFPHVDVISIADYVNELQNEII